MNAAELEPQIKAMQAMLLDLVNKRVDHYDLQLIFFAELDAIRGRADPEALPEVDRRIDQVGRRMRARYSLPG